MPDIRLRNCLLLGKYVLQKIHILSLRQRQRDNDITTTWSRVPSSAKCVINNARIFPMKYIVFDFFETFILFMNEHR